MKGFALDKNGDLIIENNEIQMIDGAELTRQTVQTVLSTNKGEWSLNVDEGINFRNILGKHKPVSATDNKAGQKDKEIYELKQQKQRTAEEESRLSKLLKKRLDGEL